MTGQLRDQDALKEEIETLRDDLLHQGEEHVEARDALKQAQGQRKSLLDDVERLEKELGAAQTQLKTSDEASQLYERTAQELKEAKESCSKLRQEFEGERQGRESITAENTELKSRLEKLQSDVTTAENLASSRFKDIVNAAFILRHLSVQLIWQGHSQLFSSQL